MAEVREEQEERGLLQQADESRGRAGPQREQAEGS